MSSTLSVPVSLTIDQAQRIIDFASDFPRKVIGLKIALGQIIPYGISTSSTEYTFLLDTDDSGSARTTTNATTSPSYSVIVDKRAVVIINNSYARTIQLIKKRIGLDFGPTVLRVDHSKSILQDASYILQSEFKPVGPDTSFASILALNLSTITESGKHNVIQAERRLGQILKSIHELENEWYGGLGDEEGLDFGEDDEAPVLPKEPCISWQECFTWMMESTIDEAERCMNRVASSKPEEHPAGLALSLDTVELRTWLSSAIGSYLFDDVEVPVLVWSPGLDWAEFVSVSPPLDDDSTVSFLNWKRAIWGDPLLEGAFHSPSQDILEGYGGSPITLPRHKIKRHWYSLWAALNAYLRLQENDNSNLVENEISEPQGRLWNADKYLDTIKVALSKLRNAKYY